MAKVPPTLRGTVGASHNPELFNQEQDEKGTVRTFFITHPGGTRKERRYKQRHHPYYTKSTHKGREWWQLREGLIALQKGKNEDQGVLHDHSSEGS